MKILIKFPTRERPEIFLKVLDQYLDKLDDKENYHVVITADLDDPTMHNERMLDEVLKRKNCTIVYGYSRTKIEAINANMDIVTDWDICLLASDDMVPRVHGYDNIIRKAFIDDFPDTDGSVWPNDGKVGKGVQDGYKALNTILCIGRKRYDRIKHLYHPSYVSLWCDNEYSDIAKSENKVAYIDDVIIENVSPDWEKGPQGHPYDNLYKKNNRHFYTDKANYEKRKRAGFPN